MNGRYHHRGFTLIELLVVIAVAIVLMTLTLTGMRNMSKRATSAGCLNQMRQIGVMANLYLGENRHTFFPPPKRDTLDNWISKIDTYNGSQSGKNPYKCPADKTPPRIERTYRFNDSWGDSGTIVDGSYQNTTLYGQSLYKVVNPSKKIMVFCVAYNGPAAMPLYKADTDTWNNRVDGEEMYFEEYPRLHGSDRVNLLFVDGHAESSLYPLPDAWYHFDRADQL